MAHYAYSYPSQPHSILYPRCHRLYESRYIGVLALSLGALKLLRFFIPASYFIRIRFGGRHAAGTISSKSGLQ